MGGEPIAVVGRGCVLPGALDPDSFWDNILAGRASLSSVPEGRWRLPTGLASADPADGREGTWSDVGGYVQGFDDAYRKTLAEPAFRQVLDPGRVRVAGLAGAELDALDPLFRWTAYAAATALRESGQLRLRHRTGLVAGNLSFPSTGMAAYAEHVWLDAQDRQLREVLGAAVGPRPPALDRFMSGLPAGLAAQALGLGLGGFALDAACASALYAVNLACAELLDRRADLMLAGGVNRADDLFIHDSFRALSAMSRSGQSRPFHRQADGLVPAEGAVFVALMRLADAIAADAQIFGVIRGVGLSNDGRGSGLLAPSADGQARAIRAAYQAAGVSPQTVGLLECHATGTRLGDLTEVRSTSQVFAGARGVPVGSVKSNVGHLITAAGGAGLLKVLGALRAGVRPASLSADDPLPELSGGSGSPLRLLVEAEDWPENPAGPRRAAVSAFGFGGNNAHLVVDHWTGDEVGTPILTAPPVPPARPASREYAAHPEQPAGPGPIAIVAIGAKVADGRDCHDLCQALMTGARRPDSRASVEVALDGLCFPPVDLAQAQAQQLLVLQTARDAVSGVHLPKDRTMVLIGMGCDPEVARQVARGRTPVWRPDGDAPGDLDRAADAAVVVEAFRDCLGGPQTPAGVLGAMPNALANRINAQLELTGPGFTVSAEEGSGLVALRLGGRALRAGDADAVLVGAVDLSHEVVHRGALADLGLPHPPGDAAVVVVLKRLADARAAGDKVLAVLDEVLDEAVSRLRTADPDRTVSHPSSDPGEPGLTVGDADAVSAAGAHLDPSGLFGRAHAASGLVAFVVAVLAVHHRAVPRAGKTALPALGSQTAEAGITPLAGRPIRARLRAGDPGAFVPTRPRKPRVYSGGSRAEVLDALAAGRESSQGPARLVVLAADAAEQAARAEAARRWLVSGGRRPEGVVFRERPVVGEVAFVFSGGSMAYSGMGRELMLAFPTLLDTLRDRCGRLGDLIGWAYDEGAQGPRHALDQVWGASVLGQLHAEITQTLLGIRPSASIGYSSGELTVLAALGAWPDVTPLSSPTDAGPDVFGRAVAEELGIVRRAWQRLGVEGRTWASYLVDGPVERVRAALAQEPAVHLMVVNTPDSSVIGGEAGGCERVLGRLDDLASLRIPYEMPAHVPELAEAGPEWRALYHLPTVERTDIRFYTCSTGQWYRPTAQAAADAVTRQQLGPIDFAGTVERAWEDGVRVFVEHGPRGLCSAWIRRTLGSREHVVVSLDAPDGQGIDAVMRAVAELLAAGVPMDTNPLARQLAAAWPDRRPQGRELTLPAHPPAVRLSTAARPATTAAALPAVGKPATGNQAIEAPATWPSGAVTAEAAQIMEPAPARAEAPLRSPVLARPAAPVLARAGAPAAAVVPAPDPLLPTARPAPAAPTVGDVPLAPVPTASPPSRSATPPSGAGTVVGLIADQLRLLGEVHRSSLALRAEVHAEFLASRRRAAALLLQTRRADPLAPPDLLAEARAATAAASVPAVVSRSMPGRAPRRAEVLEAPAVTPAPAAPAISAAPGAAAARWREPSGPTFGRPDLERLVCGPIAPVLGARYAAQDAYPRLIRLPRPPLLLPDRVTGIDAEPGSLDTGTIWTETDVPVDAWYLDPAGRMPAGITAESGQASLLLLSWLGVDHLAKGARVYRLLGCEVTFHGALPQPGETLRYEIHIDGRESFGDIPLFSFHSNCFVGGELRLTITRGQAGLFTDAELAGGRGLPWRPEDHVPPPGVLDPPAVLGGRRGFTADDVRAFVAGRPADCFGPGWELTRSHIRTPRIAGGRGQFLHEVPVFDPGGGPWGRGYLRGEMRVSPDDWFFQAHFPDDPCMPGTLMSERCFQAMAFYLAAAGFTVDRDGWRFEPVPGTAYPMQYRGQVVPANKALTYEVFVVELSAGPEPTLVADVLCTVDGRKACHGRGLRLRLVPDWPLRQWRQLGPPAQQKTGTAVPPSGLAGLVGHTDTTPAASAGGFTYDYPALLGCAWGRPSEAFGPPYAVFDSHRHLARLPGPPFHFMSRVVALTGPPWVPRIGTGVEVEYDVPEEVWYFEQNDHPVMPLAVVMEVALQASGWLAAYVGSALDSESDLYFRNLGGTATISREIGPDDRLVSTRTRLTGMARDGLTIIENFETECFVDGAPAVTLSTVFGFFPRQAFADQVGIPPTVAEAESRDRASSLAVDLAARPARYFGSSPRLPGPMLLMLDRVTGYWPDGGSAGLGRLRAEKDVKPDEWFFRAHFFQDPVQPGSLGVQAIFQLIQFYLLERGLAAGIARPRFRTVLPDRPLTWKYRGQVTPLNNKLTIEVEITEIGSDEAGPYAVADGWLWADDIRIYHVQGLGVGITADG